MSYPFRFSCLLVFPLTINNGELFISRPSGHPGRLGADGDEPHPYIKNRLAG
jgi:hypothetical protein